MEDLPDVQELQQQRYRILGEIASLGDLRPGRLTRRFHRCGKPNCHCQKEGDPGHGPYHVLQFSSGGRQTTRSIPAAQAATVRAQTEEFQRLCRLQRELVEVSEQLCQARLAGAAAGEAPEVVKKSLRGGVRRGVRGGARAVRSPGHGREPRLRGAGDLPAPQGAGGGGTVAGRAPECGPLRSHGAAAAVLLRRRGALRREASQDLHERLGAGHAPACLLPLPRLRPWPFPAGRGLGDGGHGPVPGRAAHGLHGGLDGQLRGSLHPAGGTGWGAGRNQACRAHGRSRRSRHCPGRGPRPGRPGSDRLPRPGRHRHPGAQERNRRSQGQAGGRTGLPARAKSSSCSCGLPNSRTRRAVRDAIRVRSATPQLWKAPPAATPIRNLPSSPGACAGRRTAAASPPPTARS